MKRSYLILTGILSLGLLTYGAIYLAGISSVSALSSMESDELAWLKAEFKINDSGFEKIVAVHQAHEIQCLEHCRALEASRRRLSKLTQKATSVTPEIEAALKADGAVREQCRVSTLRHVYEVSRLMTPDQGQRYVDLMVRRLIEADGHYHDKVTKRPAEISTGHGSTRTSH